MSNLLETRLRRMAATGWSMENVRISDVLALFDALAVAQGTIDQYTKQMLEHATRAEAAEDRVSALQGELADQEREKLALVQELMPLAFPANKPTETEQQYFCLCGPDDVALLMWANPGTVWIEGEESDAGPCWCEWDGDVYNISAHIVTAFWPHPKAPAAPLPILEEKAAWVHFTHTFVDGVSGPAVKQEGGRPSC